MEERELSEWIKLLEAVISEDESQRNESHQTIMDLLQNQPIQFLSLCINTIFSDNISPAATFQAFNAVNRYLKCCNQQNLPFLTLNLELRTNLLNAAFRGLLFADHPYIQEAAALTVGLFCNCSKTYEEHLSTILNLYTEYKSDVHDIIVSISTTCQNVIEICNLFNKQTKSQVPQSLIPEMITYLQETQDSGNVIKIIKSFDCFLKYYKEFPGDNEKINDICKVYTNLLRFESVEIINYCAENLSIIFDVSYDSSYVYTESLFYFIDESFKIPECNIPILRLMNEMISKEKNSDKVLQQSISQLIFEKEHEKFEEILFSITNQEQDSIDDEYPQYYVTIILSEMMFVNQEFIFSYINQIFENCFQTDEYNKIYASILCLYSFVNHHSSASYDFIIDSIKKILQSPNIYNFIGTTILTYDFIANMLSEFPDLVYVADDDGEFAYLILEFVMKSLETPANIIKSSVNVAKNMCIQLKAKIHTENSLKLFSILSEFYRSLWEKPEIYTPELCDNYFTSLGEFLFTTPENEIVLTIIPLLSSTLTEILDKIGQSSDNESLPFISRAIFECLTNGIQRYVEKAVDIKNPDSQQLYYNLVDLALNAIKFKEYIFYANAIEFLVKLSAIYMNDDHMAVIMTDLLPSINEGNQSSFTYACYVFQYLSTNLKSKMDKYVEQICSSILETLYNWKENFDSNSFGFGLFAIGTCMINSPLKLQGIIEGLVTALEFFIGRTPGNEEDLIDIENFYKGFIVAETGLLTVSKTIVADEIPAITVYSRLKMKISIMYQSKMLQMIPMSSIYSCFVDLLDATNEFISNHKKYLRLAKFFHRNEVYALNEFINNLEDSADLSKVKWQKLAKVLEI